MIFLWHYSNHHASSIRLDPLKIGLNLMTKNDLTRSAVPRIFFYTSPNDREEALMGGKTLYTCRVSTDDLYDLRIDPERLLEKHRISYCDQTDFDELLKNLSGWRFQNNKWIKRKGKYKGLLYSVGKFDVVVWFESIHVNNFNIYLHEKNT